MCFCLFVFLFVCLFVCLCVLSSVFSSFVSVFFSVQEFINSVCGLRWMCCEYYVECTNVVKNGTGVIVTTGAIKGAEVGFSNSEVQTRHPASDAFR